MSKVTDLLGRMDAREFKRFDLFVHSPFFCQHAGTIQLFEYLAPAHPHFEGKGFDDFAASCHAGQLTRTRFHLLNSYLYQQALDFLTQEEFRSQSLLHQQVTIDALRNKELFREAERRHQAATTQLREQEPFDTDNFVHHFRLTLQALDLSLLQGMRNGKPPLPEVFRVLDEFHLSYQLKYLLTAQTLFRMMGLDFPQARLEACLEQVQARPDDWQPVTQIFLHLNLLLRGYGDEHLRQLETLLDQYALRMSESERMNVYGYLQNHFNQTDSEGEPNALRNLFQLFQRMEREELILGRGEFTEHLVRNMTIAACRLEEFGWIQAFLDRNEKEIRKSVGSNIYAYVRAFLDFSRGNHSEALRRLRDVEFTDVFYRTGHQSLLLRIYYELEDIEALEGLVQTFRRFLNRSRTMSERRKDYNRNFLSVLKLLLKSKEKGLNPARCQRIEAHLNGEEPLMDRTWLRARYEALRSQQGGD